MSLQDTLLSATNAFLAEATNWGADIADAIRDASGVRTSFGMFRDDATRMPTGKLPDFGRSVFAALRDLSARISDIEVYVAPFELERQLGDISLTTIQFDVQGTSLELQPVSRIRITPAPLPDVSDFDSVHLRILWDVLLPTIGTRRAVMLIAAVFSMDPQKLRPKLTLTAEPRLIDDQSTGQSILRLIPMAQQKQARTRLVTEVNNVLQQGTEIDFFGAVIAAGGDFRPTIAYYREQLIVISSSVRRPRQQLAQLSKITQFPLRVRIHWIHVVQRANEVVQSMNGAVKSADFSQVPPLISFHFHYSQGFLIWQGNVDVDATYNLYVTSTGQSASTVLDLTQYYINADITNVPFFVNVDPILHKMIDAAKTQLLQNNPIENLLADASQPYGYIYGNTESYGIVLSYAL